MGAPLVALVLGTVLAGTTLAQPCPPPPVATGWLTVPYAPGVGKHGHSYDAHDCECYDNEHKMRAQCQVVGDTVHLAGTVQCAPGDSHCFGDATGVDTDIFATLPAPCRPTATAYTPTVELISEQPLVNPAASVRITVQKTGEMYVSGSSITCQDKPNCPFLKWCMLINTSFPIHPPPPPPLSSSPCIRFGHAIPVANHVDVTIVQDGNSAVSKTWTDYSFGSFSDWTNVFKPGTGTITVWENIAGKRGPQLLQLKGIPLTPGPLLVVLKVAASQVANATAYWPPTLPDSVEAIAASYVASANSSKVRLFNLSPDTKAAGMALGGVATASNIAYSLGSAWTPVAATTPGAFTFTDELTRKTLATKTVVPPAAPLGFTNVLLGLQSGAVPIKVVSLVDAPEGGTW